MVAEGGFAPEGVREAEEQKAEQQAHAVETPVVEQTENDGADASYEELYGSSEAKSEVEQPGTMAYLQKFLEKRKTDKAAKNDPTIAATKDAATAEVNPVGLPIVNADVSEATGFWNAGVAGKQDGNEEKIEAIPGPEKGNQESPLYVLSPEELKNKLKKIPGIGEKLSAKISGIVEDLKEFRAGLPPEQREGIYELQSAADLMQEIHAVGMKRANLIAKEFGLVEADKVDPHDPEMDDAGFEEENEIDEATLQAGESIVVDNRNVLEKAGIEPVEPMQFEQIDKPDKSYDFEREKEDPREKRKRILKAIVDTIGTTTANFFKRMDEAAGRALQNPGIKAMEQVAGSVMPSYEEAVESTPEQQEKPGIIKSFFEKLKNIRLPEGKKAALRRVAMFGATAAAAFVLNADAMNMQPAEAKQVTTALTEHVMKMPIPVHNWMDERVPADVQAKLDAANAPQPPQAEVLREPGVDRTSAPAQEIAQQQNTEDVIAALDAPIPPMGPATVPNPDTAFTAPPMPDMGSTITPNETTAYTAPQTADAVAAEASDEVKPDILNGKWLNEKVPENAQEILAEAQAPMDLSEVRTFMPTVEAPLTPENTQNPTESEMSTLEDGILDTECVNFLTALSKKEGTVYSPDGKNVCKLIIKYMNHRNGTNWNVNTAGITLTEIKSVDELKRAPDEGDIGIVLPDAVVAGIYTGATNLESVEDEEVRSILEKMMTYQIKEDDMTDEQLEAVTEYGFNHQVEPPTNY